MAVIRWYTPDLAEEREEIQMQARLLGLPVHQIVDSLRKGKLAPLTDTMWASLENTDSYGIKSLEDAEALADEYDKDIDLISAGFERGASIPAPMILTFDDRPPYLVGGNTRLMVAKAFGVTPTVLVGHVEDIKKKIAKSKYRPSTWWVTS